MSQDAAKTALAQRSQSKVLAVVAVGTGYEGATADATTMHFWKTDASGSWTPDGALPRLKAGTSEPDRLEGHLLPGASHAVFLLYSPLAGSGDSLKHQVFTRTGKGWAFVVDGGDGNPITSSTPQAWTAAAVDHGQLALTSVDTSPGASSGGGLPMKTTTWKLTNGTFVPATNTSASAAASYRANSETVFTTPSGKTTCFFAGSTIDCQSEGISASHNGHNTVELNETGWVFITGDSPVYGDDDSPNLWAQGHTEVKKNENGYYALPHGGTITGGGITCKSSETGIDCSNAVAGFHLNSTSATTRGAQGPSQQGNS